MKTYIILCEKKRIYFLWTSRILGGIRIFPQQYLFRGKRRFVGVHLLSSYMSIWQEDWLFPTKIKSVNFVPSVISIHFCHCKRRGIIAHWWVILDTKILIKLTYWLDSVLSPSSYSSTLLQPSGFVIWLPPTFSVVCQFCDLGQVFTWLQSDLVWNQCEISIEHYWQGYIWSSSQFVPIRDEISSCCFISRNVFVSS